MTRSRFVLFFAMTMLLLASALPAAAQKKINVVTSTSDLASLVQEMGGDKITVEAIARGYQDPHFVEAKPSFLLKLRRADLLIVVGLDLEIGCFLRSSTRAAMLTYRSVRRDTSMRRSFPISSTSPADKSAAQWATSIPSAIRITGSTRITVAALRKASPTNFPN